MADGGFAAGLRLNVDPTGAVSGGRKTEDALDGVKSKAKETEQQVDRMGRGSSKNLDKTGKAAQGAARRMNLLVAAATAAATAFASKSAGAFVTYSQGLAEVSTLIDGTQEEMELLDQSAKNLAATYGGTATQQVNAFYQAISAGAGGVAEANQLLATANQLAVGGVTDVTTAVDALTTVTNAYRSSGLDAATASDILFTGVRQGKTTVAELGSALGQVVPTSAAVGIGLDEVVSGIAALTATGQSTSQAVTGIRQAMVAVIKPTKEASDLAKALGLDFSTTALRAQGLAGFLEEVRTKTGGSQDAMAKLFGSVEALNAILALTGDAGVVFEDTLNEMATASGATQEAFDKVSQSLSQRLSVQLGILNGKALELGELIMSAVVPALEWMTGNVDQLANGMIVAGGLISLFFPWIGVLTVVGGLILKVGENWDYFKAAGQVALEYISSATGLTVDDMGSMWSGFVDILKSVWQAAWSVVKTSINLMIGAGHAGYTIFSELFPQIPVVIASAITAAVNSVVGGVEAMVNAAVGGINKLIEGINSLLEFVGADKAAEWFGVGSGQIGTIGEVTLGRFENDLTGELAKAGDIISRAGEQAGTDYLGNFADGFETAVQDRVARNAEELVMSQSVTPAAGSGTGVVIPDQTVTLPEVDIPDLSSGGASGSGGARQAKSEIDELADAYENLKSSVDPAYAATQEFEQGQALVNAALAAGIITQQEAAETMKQLKEEYTNLNEEQNKGVQQAAKFFTSIVSGAKSAKDAVADLAAKMADKLLNQGFELLLGGLFGGGGGGGGFLDFLFNANGNAFNQGSVQAFATGGVVDGATMFNMSGGKKGVMGEAGPEAIMPLSRGSDGKLGVKAQNNSNQGSAINVNVNYSIDARGTNNEAVENLRAEQQRDRARLKTEVIGAIREAQYDRII